MFKANLIQIKVESFHSLSLSGDNKNTYSSQDQFQLKAEHIQSETSYAKRVNCVKTAVRVICLTCNCKMKAVTDHSGVAITQLLHCSLFLVFLHVVFVLLIVSSVRLCRAETVGRWKGGSRLLPPPRSGVSTEANCGFYVSVVVHRIVLLVSVLLIKIWSLKHFSSDKQKV